MTAHNTMNFAKLKKLNGRIPTERSIHRKYIYKSFVMQFGQLPCGDSFWPTGI